MPPHCRIRSSATDEYSAMDTMIRNARFVLFSVAPLAAMVHVPFIETADYTDLAPFMVSDAENSKAIAAQLRSG